MEFKLRRPKGYQAGEALPIIIGNKRYHMANLFKGSIKNQSIVLVAVDGEWKEINIREIGLKSSDLGDFTHKINEDGINLDALLRNSPEEKPDRETPEEIVKRLSDDNYSFESLMSLWEYNTMYGRKSSYQDMKWSLDTIKKKGVSIEEFISKSNDAVPNLDKPIHKIVAEGAAGEYHFHIATVFNGKTYEIMYDLNLEGNQHRWQSKDAKFEFEQHAKTAALQEALLCVKKMVTSSDPKPSKSTNELFTAIQNKLKNQRMSAQTAEVAIKRVNDLKSLGFTEVEHEDKSFTLQGFGFTVTQDVVENYDANGWYMLMEQIAKVNQPSAPVSASEINVSGAEVVKSTPASNNEGIVISGTSLEFIGNLAPENIQELQGLEQKQLAVVAQYPFVAVTNAASLKKAKAHKAALLKESTSTEKIETDASKYLNNFKKALKEFILPKAKITRDAHDKQAAEITRWEQAEELRLAEERRIAMERVNTRRNEIQSIPMAFDGQLYSVGTVFILPSQIESATDEEFAKFISDAKAMKQAMLLAEQQQSEENRLLKEQLAQMQQIMRNAGLLPAEPVNTVPSVPNQEAEATIRVVDGLKQYTMPTSEAGVAVVSQPIPPIPPTAPQPLTYTPANDDDEMLKRFDAKFASVIAMNPIPEGWLKCRNFYNEGRKDVIEAVSEILQETDTETVYLALSRLIETIK